jgi:signal transduction histidine kinase
MAAAESVTDGRGGGLHSIRFRLLLPVAVATVGLVALGTVQALSAARLASDSRQAATMVATATATVRLAHELEIEITEEDALRQRGGSAGASLVTAARAETNIAVTDFRRASQVARAAAPALSRLLDAAETQVALLPSVRAATDRLAADELSAPTYEDLNRSLLAIADAVPELMTDVTLAANARAAAAIAAAEHLAAQERDLLRGVFRRGSYQPGELASLASLTGAESERLAEFNRYATPAQRTEYTTLISGDDVQTAARLAGAALTADRQPAALKVDPDSWYIAQSNTLRRLHLLEVDLAHALDRGARNDQAMAQTRAVVTGVSTFGLVVLALGTALVLAIRTSRRLRILRGSALVVAGVELPGTISSMTEAADPQSVQVAMRAAATRADSLTVGGSDEISEVGAALSAVHRQALHLAAEQASLRLDVAALFAALSRRGQTLIQRQLRLLDEFERSETDPQTLARLFALDHLAARMRRNEENLLVLAGGEPGRRVLAPVALLELVQAAGAEIEDYQRVEPVGVAEVGVAAHAVRDVSHLLAELLENAAMFSPPTSKVRVSARRSIDSVTISVYDEGIGMPQRQVDELNARLARPTMLTSELAGTMGLLVVGRLAARHGIHVELRSSGNGGTVALVALPNTVLTPAPAVTGYANSLLYPAIPIEAARPAPSVNGHALASPAVISGPPAPAAPPAPALSPAPAPAPALDSLPVLGPVPPPDPADLPLPRRRPGHLLLSGSAVTAAELSVAPAAKARATPDPDAVRARLTGLARGLAAADRRVQGTDQPPVGTQNTQDGEQ